MTKKLVVIILTLVMVTAIVFVVIPLWVRRYENNIVNVYVAADNISKNTLITESMVTLKKTNIVGLNTDAVRADGKGAGGLKTPVGMYAKYDMVKGEQVLRTKLHREKDVDAGYMSSLEKGYYAYPIKTDLETTGAGVLMRGDKIDMYIFTKDRTLGDRVGTVVVDDRLRNVEILDIRNQSGSMGADAKASSSTKADQKVPKVLVLKLRDEQIRELIRYQNLGDVNIAFRSRGEKRAAGLDYTPSLYEQQAATAAAQNQTALTIPQQGSTTEQTGATGQAGTTGQTGTTGQQAGQ